MTNKKVLVAFYSYSGNTKAVAEKIQSITGGDLFEIKPVKEYPNDYNALINLAKTEKQNDVRPELQDNGDIGDYELIYLGTPVWWYTMATPVKSFIVNNNFDNKTIIPFCTHGGGGASATYADMQKLAPNAEVKTGFTSYENSAKINDINSWIISLS